MYVLLKPPYVLGPKTNTQPAKGEAKAHSVNHINSHGRGVGEYSRQPSTSLLLRLTETVGCVHNKNQAHPAAHPGQARLAPLPMLDADQGLGEGQCSAEERIRVQNPPRALHGARLRRSDVPVAKIYNGQEIRARAARPQQSMAG